MVAVALTVHQLGTEPVAGEGLLTYRWSLIAAVMVEMALGLWLVSGLYRRAAWAAGCVCFVAFGGVTLYKAVTGEASCGCFGKIEVNPWITLVLDVAAVAALWVWRPDVREVRRVMRPRLRLAGVVGMALAAGLPAVVWMAGYTPATLADDGEIVGDARVVVLEPEKWVGKRWPLLGHVDIGGKLGQGEWTVMLYHDGCPGCREAVPAFVAEAGKRKRERKAGAPGMVLIEVPPYRGGSAAAKGACTYGQLSDKRDWFVETPTVVQLRDGKVLSAKEGDGSEKIVNAYIPRKVIEQATKAEQVVIARDVHDFGFVQPGSTHVVDFVVANPLETPLAIRRARSECKCMAAVKPPKSVPAKGSVKLRVVFVAPKDSMRYSKRIALLTTDKRLPAVMVRVKANVGLPLRIEPKVLELGALIAGQEGRGEVTIVNMAAKPVRLAYSTSNQPGCIALIPRAPVPAGGRLTIPVVVRPRAGSDRPRRATVRIHTDFAGQTSLAVPVRYTVSPAASMGASGKGPS